jgi:hypothetical protein
MSYERKQSLLCWGIVLSLVTFALISTSCGVSKQVYERADYQKCDCILDSDQ